MAAHKIKRQNFVTKLLMNEAIKKISEIRRSNLKLLRQIAEEEYLKQYPDSKYINEMFCEYVGLRLSIYYQLLKEETKPKFSEYYARMIEAEAKLPVLWLDKKRVDVEFNEIMLDVEKVQKTVRTLLDFVKSKSFSLKSKKAEDKLTNKVIEFMYHNDEITKEDIIKMLVEIESSISQDN